MASDLTIVDARAVHFTQITGEEGRAAIRQALGLGVQVAKLIFQIQNLRDNSSTSHLVVTANKPSALYH
jgi:hypothetical protein